MKKHTNTIIREEAMKYMYSYLMKEKYKLQYIIDMDNYEAIELFQNSVLHIKEFDDIIVKLIRKKKWSIKEINPVILSILYISLYEIKYNEIDVPIIVNDALNLSKQYSDIKSKNFVHGVLGNYLKEDNE